MRLDDIVQNVKQVNPVQTDLKNSDNSVQNSKQIASIQDDDNTQPLPDNLVQDVKQALPAQIDDEKIDDSVYDFKQIHFAVTITHKGQAKRTTVMLESYLVKALQHQQSLADNTAIRAWIEQAIKADTGRFDSSSALTKQVKRMIIESLVYW